MQSFYSFRLTSHTLFYSTVVCLFTPFQGNWPVFVLLSALTLLAGLAATNCSARIGRLLLGLLPALALLYPVTNVSTYVAAAVLAVYVAGSLAAARFDMPLWKYKQEVIVTLSTHCIFFLLLMGFFSGMTEYRPAMLMSGATLVFALLALRAQRLGQAPSGGWQLWCAAIFALPFLGGGLLAGFIVLFLPILGKLLGFLAGGFAGALYLFTTFYDKLSAVPNAETLGSIETMTGYTLPEEWNAATNEAIGHVRVWNGEFPWGYILLLMGGFAAILLICWLIWRGSKVDRQKNPEAELIQEGVVEEKSARKNRKKRRSALSNRDRIRAIYQAYLRFLSQHGVHPKRCDTTADISSASAALLRESDELLRRLYRKARYSTVGFTDEDVKTAAEAFKRLTQEENLMGLEKRTEDAAYKRP